MPGGQEISEKRSQNDQSMKIPTPKINCFSYPKPGAGTHPQNAQVPRIIAVAAGRHLFAIKAAAKSNASFCDGFMVAHFQTNSLLAQRRFSLLRVKGP
jgi:hypothetical protein